MERRGDTANDEVTGSACVQTRPTLDGVFPADSDMRASVADRCPAGLLAAVSSSATYAFVGRSKSAWTARLIEAVDLTISWGEDVCWRRLRGASHILLAAAQSGKGHDAFR